MPVRPAYKAPEELRKANEARALSRLAQLAVGRKELRPLEWPGREGVACLMRVLSCEEVFACHAAAYTKFRAAQMPVEAVTLGLFEDECITQILARALRDPERPDQVTFAIDADDIRENTTVNERAAVFRRYSEFAAEQDPDPDTMPGDLLREIEALIKKKGAASLRAFVSAELGTSPPIGESLPESSPTGS